MNIFNSEKHFTSSSRNFNIKKMKTTILKHLFNSSEIEDSLPSLQLLVSFYRLFAFSFTGVLFTSKTSSNSNNHHHLPLRLLILTTNLGALLFYLLPLFSFLLFGDPWAIHAAFKNNSEYTLGKEIFDPTFATLKPVLKTLITSMAWLMMAESTFSCGHNLILGGGILRQLSELPKNRKDGKSLDIDNRWALSSLTTVALAILTFVSFGLSTFARAYFAAIYQSLSKEGIQTGKGNPYLLLGSLSLKLLKHTYHYFTYSLYPLLFTYLMTIVKRNIEVMKEEFIEEDTEKTELPLTPTERLQLIKARLQILQGHLQSATKSLALPLTLSMIVTTLLLTGTVCFLIINSGLNGGTGSDHHFGLFFFNVAAYNLLRLVALCAAGSLAEAAHEDLLLTIYSKNSKNFGAEGGGGGWDIDSWLAFQELKKVNFCVSLLGGLYALRQSTVLGVLAFVSNHIVVLLQTENYGIAETGKKRW